MKIFKSRMKYIKTFEGFKSPINWFKKSIKEIKFSDIHECLYELLDLVKVNSNLKNNATFSYPDDRQIGRDISDENYSYSIVEDGDTIASVYSDKYVITRLVYNSEINLNDLKNTLLESESRLKGIYGCKLSFYLSFGYNNNMGRDGITDNTELKSVDKLFKYLESYNDNSDRISHIKKFARLYVSKPNEFNLTIRITSPVKIENDELDITNKVWNW